MYTINISYLGFKPINQQIELNQDLKLDFELRKKVIN